MSHCVYRKHGEEGKHYCFGKGELEAKCIEPGGGECGGTVDGVESFIPGTPGKYIHLRQILLQNTFGLVLACDDGWTYFGHTSKCYKPTESNLSRTDAVKACKALNPTANLVTILDSKTNSFVLPMVKYRSWIGLEKVNGEWVWPDGTKATYLPWLPGQPSGDGPFVEIFGNSEAEGPGK